MNGTLHLVIFSPYTLWEHSAISERRSGLITSWHQTQLLTWLMPAVAILKLCKRKKKKKARLSLTYKTSPYSPEKGAQFLRYLPAVYSPLPGKDRIHFSHFSKILSPYFFSALVHRESRFLASIAVLSSSCASYRKQHRENHNYKSCLQKLSFICARFSRY